jgi:hypothetical protein
MPRSPQRLKPSIILLAFGTIEQVAEKLEIADE